MIISRNGKCIVFILFFQIVWTQYLLGQEPFHILSSSSTDTLQVSSLTFDRLLNTFLWNGIFQKSFHSDEWEFGIKQLLHSRLIKTDVTSIQDDYRGEVVVKRKMFDWLKIKFQNNSQALTDSRIIDLNSMSQHRLLGGLEFSPLSYWNTTLASGYEWNSQENEYDRGKSYAISSSVPWTYVDEYETVANASWEYSDLGRRKPHDAILNFALDRDFEGGLSDSIVLNYEDQKREYYISADDSTKAAFGINHNITTRNLQSLLLSNVLTYPLSNTAVISVNGMLSNRSIGRTFRYRYENNPQSIVLDSKIQELQLFFSTSLDWKITQWLRWLSTMKYNEREESHSVIDDGRVPDIVLNKQRSEADQLNNIAQRTSLLSKITFLPSDHDQVDIETSFNILRYDTPDTLNIDDRDELFIVYGLEVSHRFNSFLVMKLKADAYLEHLVYLNRLESANNNWNRVFKLGTEAVYIPNTWFATSVCAEVMANYTVSDYEMQVASVRSYAFRQAAWEDSLFIRLTKLYAFEMETNIRIYERGILKWLEFSERPDNYFVEQFYWPKLIYTPVRSLRLSIGFKYFSQDRYTYNGRSRIFEQGIRSSGPTVLCSLYTKSYAVSIEGWRENQELNGKNSMTIPNLSVKVSYLL